MAIRRRPFALGAQTGSAPRLARPPRPRRRAEPVAPPFCLRKVNHPPTTLRRLSSYCPVRASLSAGPPPSPSPQCPLGTDPSPAGIATLMLSVGLPVGGALRTRRPARASSAPLPHRSPARETNLRRVSGASPRLLLPPPWSEAERAGSARSASTVEPSPGQPNEFGRCVPAPGPTAYARYNAGRATSTAASRNARRLVPILRHADPSA